MANGLEGLISSADIADLAQSENLSFDDEKRIDVLQAMRSIDVQACPGSGKTTLIAAKLILLAKKWPYRDQGICVLSHTNVAKDEIIDRIKRSSTVESQRLLSYPHFIGTIQEFVGRHLALPFVRSDGIKVKVVDTDECVQLMYSNLPFGTRTYIDRKSRRSNVLYDFDCSYEDGRFQFNVPTFPNGSPSDSYRDLLDVRAKLISDGCFFYRDIFAFALAAVSENNSVPATIQKRFPLLFIDEMQDTQRFQDELLCLAFPLEDTGCIVQRFGDPDQAIFHGIGNEKPNASFNGKRRQDMDFVIHSSYRIDNRLSEMIKPLSINEVPIETELSNSRLETRSKAHISLGEFKHSVILFSAGMQNKVIERFAELVSKQFSNEAVQSDEFSVKVVGAVGKEIDPTRDELKIGHYWQSYHKSKSKTQFKERTLIEAARYCQDLSNDDISGSYRLLFGCILRALRLAGICDENDRNFSRSSLRKRLIEKANWKYFQETIFMILNGTGLSDRTDWEGLCAVIKRTCGINNPSQVVEDYLAFEEEQVMVPEMDEDQNLALEELSDNRIRHRSGFEIQLSTIHGAKGETHDATLIVETKNHTCDLEVMLPYLVGELPSDDRPNSRLPEKPNWQRAFKPNSVFMRQLYVAASRPRHLLCIAMNQDHISDEQVTEGGVFMSEGLWYKQRVLF